MKYSVQINTQLGKIEISSNLTHIQSILFKEVDNDSSLISNPASVIPEILKLCIKQLNEYLNGTRKIFDLPVDQEGTPFQQKVWDELIKIPYGDTINYTELAIKLGDKNKTRAVAAANALNKINIVVPCHRVIGKDGKLVGYSGGLWRKKFLLNLELENTHKEFKLF
jgi:methylated-DNA-[protein]-cysteine S-methyltransferase